MKSLASAISLLTILPVPLKLTRDIKSSAVYFPLVGALIGGLNISVMRLLNHTGFSTEWASIALLLFMATITGGLHLDGLADMADGFLGGKNRNQILKIMKDSATGVFGMLALFFLLIFKWTAIRSIIQAENLMILFSAMVISRFGISLLSGLFNYAREEGTGNIIISGTQPRHSFLAFMITCILLVVTSGYGSLFLIFIGAFVSLAFGYYSQRRISGITGDVLGASCEVSETILLSVSPFIFQLFPEYMWRSILLSLSI